MWCLSIIKNVIVTLQWGYLYLPSSIRLTLGFHINMLDLRYPLNLWPFSLSLSHFHSRNTGTYHLTYFSLIPVIFFLLFMSNHITFIFNLYSPLAPRSYALYKAFKAILFFSHFLLHLNLAFGPFSQFQDCNIPLIIPTSLFFYYTFLLTIPYL